MSADWQAGYIASDQRILGGEPVIAGTHTPVRVIVEHWRMGTPPEEITAALPHLTLAQIFAALSYFADHQEQILQYIEAKRIPEELIDPIVRGRDGTADEIIDGVRYV